MTTGTLNITLNHAYTIDNQVNGELDSQLENSQSTNATGYYYVNLFINEYFIGKGLTSYLEDYRGFYFYKDFDLMMEKELIPDWYLVYEAPLWE